MHGFGISLGLAYIFPSLFLRQFSSSVVNGNIIEIQIPASGLERSGMFFSLVVVNYFLDVLRPFLLPDIAVDQNLSFMQKIRNNLKSKAAPVLMQYSFFGIVLGVVRITQIQNLSVYFEVIFFGYVFPVFKAVAVWGAVKVMKGKGRDYGWSPGRTASNLAITSAAAVINCNVSQMYAVFRTSKIISLFAQQYFPHEIIKKLSWATYLPVYLVWKLKIQNLTKRTVADHISNRRVVLPVIEDGIMEGGENLEGNPRSSGKSSDGSRAKAHRESYVVRSEMGEYAGDLVGRQLGEATSLITALVVLLPIVRENMFLSLQHQDYQDVFPSYQDLLISGMCIAIFLDALTTSIAFVLLGRAGYHITHSVLRKDVSFLGWTVCGNCCFILMLAAGLD